MVARSDIEFEARLSYSLSWYVLPSGPEDDLNPYKFSLLILAKRESLAVLPLYLGSLYYRLDECVSNIVKFVGHFHVLTHVDTVFFQLFLWKTFKKLVLEPAQYVAVETVE